MKFITNIFFAPSKAYEDLREKAVILLPIIVIVIVLSAAALILSDISAQDNATIVSQNPRLSEVLTDQQIADIRNPSTKRVIIGSISAPLVTLIGILLTSLILMIIANASGLDMRYKTTFSAVLGAGLISPVLATIFKTPLIMMKGSTMGVSTSLALLAPDAPITSSSYMVLDIFDLFSIWSLAVLIIGISVISRVPKGKAAFVVIIVWLIKNAARIGISAISMKLSGMA